MSKPAKTVFDQCVEHAKKLRSLGLPESEIRASVDALELKLNEEEQAATEDRYPEHATSRERAAMELDRASQGLPPLQGDQVARGKGLTKSEIDSINFTRAHNGQDPMTADEIRRESIRRADPRFAEQEAQRFEYAPKGMHPKVMAQENLRRACAGEPELIARPQHDDSQDDDE